MREINIDENDVGERAVALNNMCATYLMAQPNQAALIQAVAAGCDIAITRACLPGGQIDVAFNNRITNAFALRDTMIDARYSNSLKYQSTDPLIALPGINGNIPQFSATVDQFHTMNLQMANSLIIANNLPNGGRLSQKRLRLAEYCRVNVRTCAVVSDTQNKF